MRTPKFSSTRPITSVSTGTNSGGYETSNGIQQQEQAQLNNVGTENESIAVRGSYSYTGSDGVVYTVTYVADENGFQPQGAHLPKAV
ncbi:hypothetical protein MSG28_002598 [Choristoneura fumiferana]|uniref:Uncharacterized protein n=1 Tax=Choristoneura fumiferana TaxID=7141 RepID=A0ACC0JII3_CHOFU|nr:hypothetical protein MSG28_002598 [Choristoneura fumiferana]